MAASDPAVLGTILITALATVLAVPLGVLGAIYLNEYGGKGFLARVIGFMSDVMTGVPSIIMGLFIFSIWVLHFGYSGLAGALALGCLMLPVVIRSSYEMLRLVPDSLREGAYALGATKARVTATVVLPAALGGIVSGALLAVARAAGETAPLLFTVLTVTTVNANVFNGANTALPLQIFRNASQPYAGAPGPWLGRGAHPHRNCLHPHDRGPYSSPHDSADTRARTVMEETEQNAVTNLQRPAATVPARRTPTRRLGATIFDVRNVSIWYGSLQGRHGRVDGDSRA